MYKEFRELSRADAVKSLYQDMAARHRARFRSIHVWNFFLFSVGDYGSTEPPLCRSFASSKSRNPLISVVHTSNSCLFPASSSPFLTVLARSARPLLPSVPALSKPRLCGRADALWWASLLHRYLAGFVCQNLRRLGTYATMFCMSTILPRSVVRFEHLSDVTYKTPCPF